MSKLNELKNKNSRLRRIYPINYNFLSKIKSGKSWTSGQSRDQSLYSVKVCIKIKLKKLLDNNQITKKANIFRELCKQTEFIELNNNILSVFRSVLDQIMQFNLYLAINQVQITQMIDLINVINNFTFKKKIFLINSYI